MGKARNNTKMHISPLWFMLQTRLISSYRCHAINIQSNLNVMQRPALCSSARKIKQKASIGFAITASVIATFIDSLSQTQRNETKYQLEQGDSLWKHDYITKYTFKKNPSLFWALIVHWLHSEANNITNIWCMSLNKAPAQNKRGRAKYSL